MCICIGVCPAMHVLLVAGCSSETGPKSLQAPFQPESVMIEGDEEELCEEEAHAGDKPQPESTEEAQDPPQTESKGTEEAQDPPQTESKGTEEAQGPPQTESKGTEEAEDRPKPTRGSNAEYTVVHLTTFVHVCYHKELSLLLPLSTGKRCRDAQLFDGLYEPCVEKRRRK